jgi:hypothetical protein
MQQYAGSGNYQRAGTTLSYGGGPSCIERGLFMNSSINFDNNMSSRIGSRLMNNYFNDTKEETIINEIEQLNHHLNNNFRASTAIADDHTQMTSI